MRTAFVLLLGALAIGACGTDGLGNGGDDDGTGDDAPNTPDGGMPQPGPSFVLESPATVVPSRQEITYCWYFRTPNTKTFAVKRWKSSLSPGTYHMVMYTTPTDRKPPGTQNAVDCANAGFTSTWVYSARTLEASVDMPADDGDGNPVAMEIPPNQAGFLQLHYYNLTDGPLTVNARIEAEGLEEGVAYTKTSTYVAFNSKLSIQPQATSDLEAQTCQVSSTSKFWLMSMYAFDRATRTTIRDGMPGTGSMVFENTDTAHPGARRWASSPYHTFTTGKLTYECLYNNPTSDLVGAGPSVQVNEMCVAAGYFFPATRPVFCLDGAQ
jgi:hypothetical protein